MSFDMAAVCPQCGAQLVWHVIEDGDELAERVRSLEAEYLRPVPPAPIDPRRQRHRGNR